MKRNGPTHPKTHILAELLKIPLAQAVGHLEMLWHFAATYAPDGAFRDLSRACIAQRAGWHGDPNEFIQALLNARATGAHGFLEEHPNLGLVIHDWSAHADDTVRKGLVNRGDLFWDGKRPYGRRGETPPKEGPHTTNDSRTARESFANNSPLPKPEPKPEPEPEPKPEWEERVRNVRNAPRKEESSALDALIPSGDDVMVCWNEMARSAGLPMAQKFTAARQRSLKLRLRDAVWRERWREAIGRIPNSPFLTGRNQNRWKASLDWFLKEDALTRILEGTYDEQTINDRSCRVSYPEGHPYARR